MRVMLQMIETQESRPTLPTGKADHPILHPESHADAAGRQNGSSHCLWCGRAYTPRKTGGSPQQFCSTGHRQAFWVAARRWTMRAVEAGLINVECLKMP